MKATRVIETLLRAGHLAKRVQLGVLSRIDEVPYVVLSHTVYPGVEAHLFTAADAALWIPAFTSLGDVVLYEPKELDEGKSPDALESTRSEAWQRLFTAVEKIANLLTSYREYVDQGYIPSMVWAHHEAEWYLGIREAPDHESRPVDEFLDYVDVSIRPHIRELNELGFITIESCSGLADDHADREPYRPYVMFDDRAYIDVSAHLFTVADIAQWIPSYAPHGFDVVVHQRVGEDTENAWNRLVEVARVLAPLLKQYRELVRDKGSPFRRMRKQRECPKSLV